MQTTVIFSLAKSNFDTTYIKSLLYGACFARVVSNSFLIPPEEHYGYLSNLRFTKNGKKKKMWEYWHNSINKSEDYKLLHSVFNGLDENLKDILRQLLHWNPAIRNANNKPMDLILKSKYFDAFNLEKNPKKLTKEELKQVELYQGTNDPIEYDETLIQRDTLNLKQYHLLENKVCGGCGIEPHKKEVMYLCSCCAGVFCGEGCQRIKH